MKSVSSDIRVRSFCHAIAQTAIDTLRAGGHEVIYHDLYQSGSIPSCRRRKPL